MWLGMRTAKPPNGHKFRELGGMSMPPDTPHNGDVTARYNLLVIHKNSLVWLMNMFTQHSLVHMLVQLARYTPESGRSFSCTYLCQSCTHMMVAQKGEVKQLVTE